VPAQHPVADRMKRPAPESAGVHGQKVCDAIEHLPRGFVRESQQQDVSRINPVL